MTGTSAGVEEEDEEYEPDFPTEDAEQIKNALDSAPSDALTVTHAPDVDLGPFVFPPPPPLTAEETAEHSKVMVNRVFGVVSGLDDSAAAKTQRPGFSRLAASAYDRDAWVTIIARLATRTSAGLEDDNDDIKMEDEPSKEIALRKGTGRGSAFSTSAAIREALHLYVVEDFRRRIDVAIAWLNEEWYNDRIRTQAARRSGEDKDPVVHYDKWVLKFLDSIIPYLDAKDKVLIRLLSEIPSIGPDILERVKKIAQDPERVTLAINALQ